MNDDARDCAVRTRLNAEGLSLPQPSKPGGAYSPTIVASSMLSIAAQFPILNGEPKYTGRIGAELSLEDGIAAAQLAALNVLAQIETALAGFDRLRQIVHVQGFMLTSPDFPQHARVMDGASNLFHLALHERAGHTRALLGVHTLPVNLPIELVVTAEIDP